VIALIGSLTHICLEPEFDNQYPELLSQWAILNRMIHLGKPDSVPIAA
jgi:hypothetical protein